MITLTRKLKKDGTSSSPDTSRRISVRDRLLIKEVQEMEQEMQQEMEMNVVVFNDPNVLSEFTLTVSPDEGMWKGGKFKFTISVPEEYNMIVSLCF